MSLHRLRVPDDLPERAARAERPGRVPRGYFDPLLPATKHLLRNGFKLSAAADWLISERVLPASRRQKYMDSMRTRFSQFRYQQSKTGKFDWREELGMDLKHAVPCGTTTALCGAKSSLWLGDDNDRRTCPVCQGVIAKQNVNINRKIRRKS